MFLFAGVYKRSTRHAVRGQVMLGIVIFFLAFSLALVVGFAEPVLQGTQAAGEYMRSRQSYFAAESLGADLAYRLKNGMETAGNETLSIGDASASASVTSNLGSQQIVSTGSLTGLERAVSLTLTQGAGVAFNYGVQAGEGGFVLKGGATVNGNVYANGTIQATTGVYINGTAVAADSAALTADQSNDSPSSPPTTITFGNNSATQDLAQSFQVSTSGTLNKMDLYLKKVGSPGNLTVRITTDSGGKPATSDITDTSLAASLVTSSFGWVTVTFPANVNLQPGVTYWLVLDGGNSSNKYYIAGANSTYGSGQAKIGKYGNTWNDTSPAGLDAYFRVYFGGLTSMIGGDTYDGGVYISGDAWASKVQGASVSGNLWCQTGSDNNKSCDTSRPDPSPEPMPVSDGNIAQWKSEAEDGGVYNGDYTVGYAGATLGPKEITGDLTVGGGGTLVVSGTLWVQGNLTVSGGGQIALDSSYGPNSGVIVVDGTVDIKGGGSLAGSGTSGSYLMILTTSDCPFDSTCAGTSAITLGGGATSVILNAQKGDLLFDGGATLNEATAYQITISGGGTIDYDSGLANQNFSNGPSGGYSITGWQEQAP